MKVIISQDGIKRQLADKPFDLWVDREAAEALVRHLNDFLSNGGVSYGWIAVAVPIQGSEDIDPRPWTAF